MLIHIGYAKTASTWLQGSAFSNEAAGFCIPPGLSRAAAIDHLRIVNPFTYDPQDIRNAFSAGVSTATEQGLVPVLSDETLAGNLVNSYVDARLTADRIFEAFPQARILICIREQKGMVLSLYSEYMKQGETTTIEEFIGVDGRRPGAAPLCDIEQLEYHHLIAYYQNLFGKDRVLVLPFERLSKSPTEFLQTILNFADSPGLPDVPALVRNRALGAGTLALRRSLNRWCKEPDFTRPRQPISWRLLTRFSNVADRLMPASVNESVARRLRGAVEQHVGNRFALSNRQTSELVGCDLAELGYDI